MYYSDRAISDEKQDELGRTAFAETLANTIINLKNTDTFTIGLYGKWGNGKTSIINLLVEKLKKIQDNEQIVIIKFEPWHFADTTQLLDQFLIRLANEFLDSKLKFANEIGEALTKYASAFELAEFIPVPILNKLIAKAGKKGMQFLGKSLKNDIKEKDILGKKQIVVNLLKKLKNKVLLIVDDIERLNNDQIRQVFQLVSSVANFPNTTYLLSFDKEIVAKALEKVQEGSGEDYLEKIIQIPIPLPQISKRKISSILLSKINDYLKEKPNISISQEHWNELYQECILPFITTIRDVKRLMNMLEFKMANISNEVDFVDMISITCLEIGLPSIYRWVINNKELLTIHETNLFIKENAKEKNYEKYYNEFSHLLKDEYKNEKLVKDNVEIAINVLSKLFPVFGEKINKRYISMIREEECRNNYISYEKKFDRYFELNIDEIVIRQGDLKYYLNEADKEDLQKYILTINDKKLSRELLYEIRVRRQEFDASRLPIIISAIIDAINSLYSSTKNDFLTPPVSHEAIYLVYLLIERIDNAVRKNFFINKIKNMKPIDSWIYAEIINTLELAYGRLAANGIEHTSYSKWLTLDELKEIEEVFTCCCKELLKGKNLFDWKQWRMVHQLLTNFDGEFIDKYMNKAFNDNKNIAKFLLLYTNKWVGSNISYQIGNKNFKYLNSDKIMQAIENLSSTKELFELDEDTQERVAVYYLYNNGVKEYDNTVSQKEAQKQLAKWKKN